MTLIGYNTDPLVTVILLRRIAERDEQRRRRKSRIQRIMSFLAFWR